MHIRDLGKNIAGCRKNADKHLNIAFQKDLLKEIDKAAKNEFRRRSEFIREAARLHLDRKKR